MTFSDRYGFGAPERDVVVRHDAPRMLREAITALATKAGLSYKQLRTLVCQVLLVRPDTENWSEIPNIRDEVFDHMYCCNWFKVYDIAEALYARLRTKQKHQSFEMELNRVFRERGIGWQMVEGRILYRDSGTFGHVAERSVQALKQVGLSNAAKEMREAVADISRRPEPDVTGAVQHAMSALEAAARQVTRRRKATLGQLIGSLNLRPPLNNVVKQLWGFASNEAGHGSEESSLDIGEAALIVAVAGAVCEYVTTTAGNDDDGRA